MEAAAPAPPPPPIPPALGYADSLDSSPRSRNTDSWDDPSLPSLSSTPSAKLRLMCSYGGHIVPRPHDKSLCYLGGDTRIVVVDRTTLSLSSLSSKLSSTLLDGRLFSLKYQLPNEDLDSLISVTTDEDLDNMIDEYDRTTAASAHKPSRLRLFLFPSKPDSASSIGSLLDDSKSETWFVDALNGAGVLPRGLSAASADSADVNCLLGLDDSGGNGGGGGGGGAASDAKTHPPDSPMLETASSSFGSTSSAHFLSNLPPIRVHVDESGVRMQEPKTGLEEQFSQMNVSAAAAVSGAATGAPLMNISPSNENLNRVFSDDERVEQGLPVTNRKPPQPPQQQQQQQQQHQLQQQKQTTSDMLPDTVTRENSNIPGVISRPKPVFYQDPVAARDRAAVTATISSVPEPKREVSNPNYRVPIQVQDPSYVLPPMQPEQQQFVHATPHYIHHHATGPVPISSYYQMHPMHQPQPLQQQQQQQAQQQQQHRMDQQYPMYFMPVGQNQPYNLALQSNLADGSSIASSKPAPLANPGIIAPSYKESTPIYPARSAQPPKPELTANLYRTAAAAAPQPLPTAAAPLVHMSDQQQQYMGYHQMHHPSQSAANFPYEYADQLHAQIYYTQAPPATLAPQYQTVSPGAMISEAAVLSPPAVTAEAKQNRTSQPL